MSQVNHSIGFKNPETGETTNRIEAVWRHAKESFSTHNRQKHHVAGNLARYIFLKSVRAKNADPTEEFYRIARTVYSPVNGSEATDEDDIDDIDLFE